MSGDLTRHRRQALQQPAYFVRLFGMPDLRLFIGHFHHAAAAATRVAAVLKPSGLCYQHLGPACVIQATPHLTLFQSHRSDFLRQTRIGKDKGLPALNSEHMLAAWPDRRRVGQGPQAVLATRPVSGRFRARGRTLRRPRLTVSFLCALSAWILDICDTTRPR